MVAPDADAPALESGHGAPEVSTVSRSPSTWGPKINTSSPSSSSSSSLTRVDSGLLGAEIASREAGLLRLREPERDRAVLDRAKILLRVPHDLAILRSPGRLYWSEQLRPNPRRLRCSGLTAGRRSPSRGPRAL